MDNESIQKIKQANEENEGMLKMLMMDVESGVLAFSKLALLGYRTTVAKNTETIKEQVELLKKEPNNV